MVKLLPMAIATKNNTHQVAMLNSSNVFGLPSQIKKAIAVKNIPTFDKIIFGNQTLVDEFKHKHPKFSDRFSVLYNGVDIKKFPFNKSTPQQSELPVICMVAKLRPEKRHLDVLKAISNLNAKDFPVKLLAVGGIHLEFVEFADELKRFCVDNSIEHLVDFVGETKDVGQYLQASDLFLMPSHETFSNALLEAMAYGTPVLGADIGGTAEIIEDNQTGYLYQFSNVDNLTERLYEILQDLPGTLK
ncbi:glycosyltransferase [Vibrio alfacsensis]|uniref:Glycosyltransferase n=1 Tax=Vibrio alfacsensis TaxID=1074311 RepID=A0ABN5PI06_9VIBR|nr:glycosyltransferase family 4 protein [Vibrio alfacsensis]AXY02855.1 glycosyltransferase [Vibrio alfacsensis]